MFDLIVEEGGASDLLFYGLAKEVVLYGVWLESCFLVRLSKLSHFIWLHAKVIIYQKMQRLEKNYKICYFREGSLSITSVLTASSSSKDGTLPPAQLLGRLSSSSLIAP